MPVRQRALPLLFKLEGVAWKDAADLDQERLSQEADARYFADWVKLKYGEVEVRDNGKVTDDCAHKPPGQPTTRLRYNNRYWPSRKPWTTEGHGRRGGRVPARGPRHLSRGEGKVPGDEEGTRVRQQRQSGHNGDGPEGTRSRRVLSRRRSWSPSTDPRGPGEDSGPGMDNQAKQPAGLVTRRVAGRAFCCARERLRIASFDGLGLRLPKRQCSVPWQSSEANRCAP